MQLIILLAWMVFNYFYISSRPHQIILSDNLSLDNKLTYINFLVLSGEICFFGGCDLGVGYKRRDLFALYKSAHKLLCTYVDLSRLLTSSSTY